MMGASSSFTATLLRDVNLFMVQGSQTALANGRGRLAQPLPHRRRTGYVASQRSLMV
jgi:hypothetical protein